MGYENILYEQQEGVAKITLNRPHALNALTLGTVEELGAAFEHASSSPEVRAIVLTGAGRGFCSGADLADAQSNRPRDAEGRIDLGESLHKWYEPVILKMREMDKPVISAVNGIAAGVGCSFALLADLTIAARSAKFLLAFVNIGLVPDGGATWLLPRMTTLQRATGMALLGEKIPAGQALEWGLIWQVVDDEHLLPTAMAIAKKLADGPSIAIASIKRALGAAHRSTLAESLAVERDLQRRCGQTEDFMEGALAFLEKRKAVFRGR